MKTHWKLPFITFLALVVGKLACLNAQQPVTPSTEPMPSDAVKEDKAEKLRNIVWGGRKSPVPVTESDPIFPLLVEYRNGVKADFEERGFNAAIQQIKSIDTPSCKVLFPELRFCSYYWSFTPKVHDPGWSYAILEKTIAVDLVKWLVVAKIPPDDEFLKLLIDHRIAIRDKADAKLVWESYCETHNRPFWDYGIEKVSESEWRLGVFKSERTVAANDEFSTIEGGI